MTNSTNCDRFADQLADLLEKTLDESTRTELEVHAISCGTCGPLLGDLRKLQGDAANLPELTPSHDLWSGIEARIATPVVAIKRAGAAERLSGGTRSKLWIGLAAAGLVAVTATITHVMTKRSLVVEQPARTVATVPSSDTAGRAAPTSSPAETKPDTTPAGPPLRRSAVLPVSNRLTPEQTYDQEIARLRTVLAARRPQLDSATIAIVDHNLQIIDTAIAQCRKALQQDPASRFLIESLDGAMNDKVTLLRTAAALPVRT
jgi:hypothetical protein